MFYREFNNESKKTLKEHLYLFSPKKVLNCKFLKGLISDFCQSKLFHSFSLDPFRHYDATLEIFQKTIKPNLNYRH